MGSRRDCIVTYIDLIGTKELMRKRDPKASRLMRKMYDLLRGKAATILKLHQHVYAWNDSVLLFAYLDESGDGAKPILAEVNTLKEKIDALFPPGGNAHCSFVIAVQGRPFEDIELQGNGYEQTPAQNCDVRVTIVQASSYAFANCFAIEKRIKEEIKKEKKAGNSPSWFWYLDQRIVERFRPPRKEVTTKRIQLFRREQARAKIFIYDAFPWNDD